MRLILELPDGGLSKHSLDQGSFEQMECLEDSLVGAAVAEKLAPQYQLDEQTAFSCALLHQFGLCLVAWNYPGVYAEALKTLKHGEVELEQALSEELGFSPAELAIQVLHEWGMTEDELISVGLVDSDDEDWEERSLNYFTAHTVQRLCKVGQAFARARRPGRFPSAREDWAFASEEISRALGPDGLQIIRDHVGDVLEAYRSFLPDMFQAGTIQEPEFGFSSLEQRANPYLALCDSRLREALSGLYDAIDSQQEAAENIKFLLKEVIPKSDFSGACVYTIDPSTLRLVPQFTFGELHLRENSAVEYSLSYSSMDNVSVAFQSSEPVVSYQSAKDGKYYSSIAGYFGVSQRIGVVYLELPKFVSDDIEQLNHFKAMRWALNDSLYL